ncbi:MAG TPA: hypothetical protein VJT13_24950 [Xanthobacteraceae bacterium]|nr:hypothetical protein [Xanthobacteraceae bacterium]
MTVYEEEVEARRPSGMGTKVLVLACVILAILGSFWGIVWFIRAYVEPPRVMMPAPLALAARESAPAPVPPSREAQPAETPAAPPAVIEAQAAPAQPALTVPPPAARNVESTAFNPIADRWSAMDQFAPSAGPAPAPAPPPPPAPVAAPIDSAPAALATATATPDPDEVAESATPAIEGPPPLPRRKPIVTAARRPVDPPLPRPRPEAAEKPSVWTAVPTTDDRFPQQ